ncbi:MAG: hypothetical protein HN929_11495 [Chloroflexi bacterium]|jgi:hypothetical protein|nr:hypothetical protein [Chloroflexota bacterium]
MYKHKLLFDNQMFETGMTVPVTATEASTGLRAGGTRSRIAVTVLAATEVKIADAKKFTISLKECATETGTFAAPAASSSMVTTMSAATTYAVGDRISSLVLPENIGKWVKAVITTDDTAPTGKIDVFLEYLGG